MKTALTTEGWIALLGVLLTAIGAVLNATLPPELQPLVEWILLALQGIGMILILLFARGTARLIARLRGR